MKLIDAIEDALIVQRWMVQVVEIVEAIESHIVGREHGSRIGELTTQHFSLSGERRSHWTLSCSEMMISNIIQLKF
jgi:hypothetical protein